MKKLLVLLLVLFTFTAYGADVKISNLPTVTSLSDTDIMPVVASSTTSKITVTSLKTIFQPYSSVLATYAGITPSANVQSLLGSADYSAMRTNLGLVIGTNVQAYNADLATLASGGTANCLWGEKSDASGIECKTTLNIQIDDSAAQFKSSTASKGTLKFDQTGISDTKLVTVKYTATDNYTFTPTLLGNVSLLLGTTFTNSKYCTYSTSTGLTCNADGGGGTGDLKADGTVPMTAALVPNAANTIALGSTSAEWADIYLGDGAVIYGQNDQSNTMTSSATGWSFAKPITVADVSNDNYIKITNNTSRAATASVNEIYPEANVWKVNQNGTESSVVIGPTAEQITFSGTLTNGKLCSYATGGAISCNSDTSGTGDVTGTGDCASGACYDGTSDGGTYVRLYDGTSAYSAITAAVRAFTFSSSVSNSEDLTLTLGNNDNSVTLSSSTGVTKASLSALNLVTTGTISGKIPMISKSGNYTLGTDNAQEAYGYMVWLTGDGTTLTLPAVAAGMSVCVYSADSYDKVVDPNANDGIRNGTTTRNADGHSITSGATDQGSFVCLVGDSADGWTVLGKSGTWTDE